MTITMTDAEINRWIAEKIEPLATLPQPNDEGEIWVWRKSPLECWNYFVEDNPRWKPYDFINDSIANDLLLDRMANEDWFIEENWDPLEKEWTTVFIRRGSGNLDYHAAGPDRKRCRAEAFMRANGYQETP